MVQLLFIYQQVIISELYFYISELIGILENGWTELVKLLAERGASVNQPRKDGITPLYIAAEKNLPEIVQILIQYPF